MKRDKLIYWISTGIVSAMMLASAYMYLANEEFRTTFSSLGFPGFFVTILGVAKLLGAIALVAPIPERVKEWAYAGFAFVFIGAVWTHFATHTPWVMPFVFLMVLGVSYYFRMRITSVKNVTEHKDRIKPTLANVTDNQ